MATDILPQELACLSNADVLRAAPAFGNFSRDELEAFCAGFRRCAEILAGTSEAIDPEYMDQWWRENLRVLGLPTPHANTAIVVDTSHDGPAGVVRSTQRF